LISRQFNLDDQLKFAELSGDCNPAHIDPVEARRLIFGRPVVHGIHALLWSLENVFLNIKGPLQLTTLKTSFKRPIGIEEKLFLQKIKTTHQKIEFQLATDVAASAHVIVSYQPIPSTDEEIYYKIGLPPKYESKALEASQLDNASGDLDLYFDKDETSRLFPELSRKLPPSQLAHLLALTRLIGMECPGLHSIFSELNINFINPVKSANKLEYKVKNFISRISLATIDVSTSSMKGTLKAFLRPPVQTQQSYKALKDIVQPMEFSNQKALIIGGSRGLGEVTAKLLSAGGAKVTITYHKGLKEAQSLVEDISNAGGNIKSIQMNILKPDIKGIDDNITHLYFFPTPYIHAGAHRSFSYRLFKEFSDYYVDGFMNTVLKLREYLPGPLKCFYPSSTALDELPPNMGEYSAAKAAGETLCNWLEKTHPEISIFQTRLPRTQTDQTTSLLPAGKNDPVELMLTLLRRFQQSA